MAYPIKCYKDGWQQGNPITIYIPEHTDINIRGSNSWKNISHLFEEDSGIRDDAFTCTYIVRSVDTADIDVIVNKLSGRYLAIDSTYTQNNPLKLYYMEYRYISFYIYGSNISMAWQNTDGTNYLGTYKSSSYKYVTFPGILPKNTRSNIPSEPYCGKITIENIRITGLETEYYYAVTGHSSLNYWRFDWDYDIYSLNGGGTTSGGGTGTFSDTGDNIDIPALPTLSAVDTGFITLFNPSLAELKSLASYMWAGLFDISTFKKIFADPMDCILGLSIVPVAVPSGAAAEVKVGNIGTGINITTASAQYVELDCGTLNVQEFWGAYLDYDPYTKFEIYLPYIGTHAINADDIMGKTIQVVYHVDILSGACNAYLKCGGTVLYTFIGQCASSIPITGNDWTNVINGVLSIAGAIGTMVATGGATAPMAAGTIASTAVNGFKSNVEKSGSMSGTGGMLAIQKPYLICTRPRQAVPANQNEFLGYPAFITKKLSDITGYTEVEEIHLENLSATEAEVAEITRLLKTGVII